MKLFKFPEDQEAIREVVSKSELASLLVPSPQDVLIAEVCDEARTFLPASVIATPFLCPKVYAALEGTGVTTVCINSLMPAQDEHFDSKMLAIEEILKVGVKDFDFTAPVGMIRDKEFDQIEKDFSVMSERIKKAGGQFSIILETEVISYEEQILLAQAAVNAGADYLRICSGMDLLCGINSGRAVLRSICQIKDRFGDQIKIKAGGGWEYAYLEDCHEYIMSGADRIDIGPRFIQQLKDMNFRR